MNRFAEAIEKAGVDVVPQVVVGGGSGSGASGQNLMEGLLTMLLSERMGVQLEGNGQATRPEVAAMRDQILKQLKSCHSAGIIASKQSRSTIVNIPMLFGPYGSAALAQIDQLAAYDANACWFHMFDEAAFEACARHSIAACVEFKTFRADFDAHPELIPIGADGQPIRYGKLVQGVCLSQTAFLEQIEAQLRAGIRAYRPAGIWLDYLTYAGWFELPDPDLQESCFCGACIATFCEWAGVDAPTPTEILAQHAQAWAQHKCTRIAAFAERYAQIIRAELPGCLIGAYMCPWAPEEFGGALSRIFGQDYARLAPAIDVFTPLIYATKSGRPASWGRVFIEAAPAFVPPERKLQLILDALDGPASLLETAAATRPSWGLQLFGGAAVFADLSFARAFQTAVDRIRAGIGEPQI